jgi:phosphoglycolate phosphatase-like HAD superfamily hydrolase
LSIEIPVTDWNKYKDVTDTGIALQIFDDVLNRRPSSDEINNIKNRHAALLEETILKDSSLVREVAGAGNMIKELKNKEGWEVGIATGSWKETGLIKIKPLNLEVHDIPYAHSDIYSTKYDIIKDLVERIKKEKGISAFKKVVNIGDRIYDYETAKMLNIDFIGVDSAGDGKLKSIGVKKIIKDFTNMRFFFKLLDN